jgi:hypothetical protein
MGRYLPFYILKRCNFGFQILYLFDSFVDTYNKLNFTDFTSINRTIKMTNFKQRCKFYVIVLMVMETNSFLLAMLLYSTPTVEMFNFERKYSPRVSYCTHKLPLTLRDTADFH